MPSTEQHTIQAIQSLLRRVGISKLNESIGQVAIGFFTAHDFDLQDLPIRRKGLVNFTFRAESGQVTQKECVLVISRGCRHVVGSGSENKEELIFEQTKSRSEVGETEYNTKET